MKSKRWSLNHAELHAVIRNALIFLAPVAITLLTMLQAGDGNLDHYRYAVEVWAIGVGLDFFRKFSAGK